jgi:tetratricopeptide (TPR) repeat protein
MQDSWDMDLMALETPLPRTVLNSSLQAADLDSFKVFGNGLNTLLNQSLADSESEQACQSLSKSSADLAQLLSLFASAPISWNLVELVTDALHWNQAQVDLARIELHSIGILQFTSNGYCTMEPSTQQYLQAELGDSSQASLLKQAVATAMASVAKQIVTASSDIAGWDVQAVMPHLAEAARNMVPYFSDESAQWCFLALGGFYLQQQSYGEAKDWYSQCLSVSLERFGSVHPAVVTSLNNLAYLYTQQGYFDEALPLYWKALDLCQQVFGGNHLSVATSLNNLAGL